MGAFFKVIGTIWLVLGCLNIFGMFYSGQPTGVLTIGLIFNVALFITPGGLLIGIGEMIGRKRDRTGA